MTEPRDDTIRVVLTTAPTSEVAERLASELVEERLAACANVVPGVVSIYRWEGEVQREGELLLFIKTTEASLEALRARLVELHPYDVPEVVALPVAGGHGPYLTWVRGEVAPE